MLEIDIEKRIVNGVWEGYIGRVNRQSIRVFTGKRMSGVELTNFFASGSLDNTKLKVYGPDGPIYLTYESIDISSPGSVAAYSPRVFVEERTLERFIENFDEYVEGSSGVAKAAAQEALDAKDELTTNVGQALEELDEVKAANQKRYLDAVSTVAERDSAYPTPENGDSVWVSGEGKMYRYNGTEWKVTNENDPSAIDMVNQQLAEIVTNVTTFKNANNTWSDALELAYHALPEHGGKILIPTEITISRSFNLRELGSKVVLIEGNSIGQNMVDTFTSRIVKNGNFDAIVLNGGSSMRNIMVTKANGVTDTSDGIWIAGLGCRLENVAVIKQGGDGIRVGNKNGSNYNANLSRLINVGAYGNSKYGIHYSDDTAPTLPNANAGLLLGVDCRDNGQGGLIMENCIDSQLYSPDCENNNGYAGINIANNADGITIYSPYTENPMCQYEIIINNAAKNITVYGYRGVALEDKVVNNSISSLVYGRHGSKTEGTFVKGKVTYNDFSISRADSNVLGRFRMTQDATGDFNITTHGTDQDKRVRLSNANGSARLMLTTDRVEAKELRVIGQDYLSKLQIRKPQTAGFTLLRQSSQTFKVDAFNVNIGDVVLLAPSISLPSGVEFFGYCRAQHFVDITIKNTTASDFDLSDITWSIVVLNGTRIT